MNSQRQGIALLIALAAVIVVLAAIGITLQALSSTQRTLVLGVNQDRQRDLLEAGEVAARAWVVRASERLVLSPQGGAISVINDALEWGTDQGRLQVWISDGLAAMPWEAVKLQADLRGRLPGRWAALVPVARDAEESAHDVVERIEVPQQLVRFPRDPHTTAPVRWGPIGVPALAVSASDVSTPVAESSLVDVVSFSSDGRINVNTAPAWLLEAVYQRNHLGGLEDVMRRRDRGEFSETDPPVVGDGLRLVARSDRWNALIVTTWNGRRRAWWVELSGNSEGARILQRHDADEQ